MTGIRLLHVAAAHGDVQRGNEPCTLLAQPPLASLHLRKQFRDQFLLLGDVVWDMENVRSLTGRPHVIGSLLIRGDEKLVAHQIRALHDLVEREGERIHLLPSHDARVLAELQRRGLVGSELRVR